MRKKLPKKIKVGNIVYKVSIKDKVIDDDGRECWGTTGYQECEISIMKRLPYQKKVETFLHEVTHAIFEQAKSDICNDESIVDPIGKTLEQVIRENKKMWGDIF